MQVSSSFLAEKFQISPQYVNKIIQNPPIISMEAQNNIRAHEEARKNRKLESEVVKEEERKNDINNILDDESKDDKQGGPLNTYECKKKIAQLECARLKKS